MEDHQANYIEKNLDKLAKITSYRVGLLAILKAAELLDDEDVQLIEQEYNRYGNIRAMTSMYNTLKNKENSYETLVEALREGRQTGAVKILNAIPPVSDAESSPEPDPKPKSSKTVTKKISTKRSVNKNEPSASSSKTKRQVDPEPAPEIPAKKTRKAAKVKAERKPLVIGTKDCRMGAVVTVFEKSDVASTFVDEWDTLARNLDTPETKITTIRKSLLVDKTGHFGALTQILTDWKNRESEEATLDELINILESIKWNGFADALKRRFLRG